MFDRLKRFLKRLFYKSAEKPAESQEQQTKVDTTVESAAQIDRTTPQQAQQPHTRPGQQAIKQDVSHFMKHGRQLPHYRKSVKAKKQPEEEEEGV